MYCCNAFRNIWNQSHPLKQLFYCSFLLKPQWMFDCWCDTNSQVFKSQYRWPHNPKTRGTWTGRHFLWLTSSYNNRWNSQFVGKTPCEEAQRKLFATMAMHGIPCNASYTTLSSIHQSHSAMVFIMPKILNYTRTRIKLLYN